MDNPDNGSNNSGDNRVNIETIKQRLSSALGSNADVYWKSLREFVQGKLTRQEFDFYANLYIPADKVNLHNQFILANIHNATRVENPPLKGEAGKKKKKKISKQNSREEETKRLKAVIKSLGKQERERIKNLGNIMNLSANNPLLLYQPKAPVLPIKDMPGKVYTEYQKGFQVQSCIQSKMIPNSEILRTRMKSIALEHGLFGGVEPETSNILLYALESHLKTIITNCLVKLRTNRTPGIKTAIQPRNVQNLSVKDFLFTFSNSPNVLVEYPLNLERFLLTKGAVGAADSDDDEGIDGVATSNAMIGSSGNNGN